MKKFLILFLFFINIGITFSDSGNSNVSWDKDTGAKYCGNTISHGLTHNGVPNSNGKVRIRGNTSCSTHTYYNSYYRKNVGTNNPNVGGITSCDSGDRVVQVASGKMRCQKYDDIFPILNFPPTPSNDRYTEDITIDFSVSDSGGSGIAESRYSWDTPDPNCNNGTTFTNSKHIVNNQEGIHTLYICVKDGAGNLVKWEGIYKLDKTSPNVSIKLTPDRNNIWSKDSITANIVCNDPISGCDPSSYEYKESTSPINCDSSGSRKSFSTQREYNDDGTTYLCVRAKDIAGNINYSDSPSIIRIDKTPPNVSDNYLYDNTWSTGKEIIVELTATDPGTPNVDSSGIKETKRCIGYGCIPDKLITENPLIIKKEISNYFNNYIRYQTWDNAGNESSIKKFILKIKNPPEDEEIEIPEDNDSDARSYLIGYVAQIGILENIFWSNEKTNRYIKKNKNNNGEGFIKIGDIVNGILHIEINKNAKFKLVKFNRNSYNLRGELTPINTINGTDISAGSGYLQKNNLALSQTITGNEYDFDFSNNDYGLFIINNGPGVLKYKISATDKNNPGKKVYIAPINDSLPNEIKVLEGHIAVEYGIYYGKQIEYIKLKK